MGNALYRGDNLDVLRRWVPAQSVDLVYLDPPFQSGRDYSLVKRKRARGAKAFEDTWTWDRAAQVSFESLVRDGPIAGMMRALRTLVGEGDRLAYLSMMAPRLIELRRVLKPNGSIYLHCDPTASHYLKVLMDSVFGPGSFRSEIIWSYRRWPNPPTNFQHMHDVILYYAMGDRPTFHAMYEPASASFLKRFKGKGNRLERGATTKRASKSATPGMPLRDVWEMPIIAPASAERLGYPTQKPLALLERIVRVSSNEGDLVLDPFCGGGTTLHAARSLKRSWIGIDASKVAIKLVEKRLDLRHIDAARAAALTPIKGACYPNGQGCPSWDLADHE